MKTALFVTDCSIDSALSLRNWLSAHARQPIRLTVVYPYDLPSGLALNRNTLQPAKTEALSQLKNWSAMLDTIDITWLTTETILASPELALSIHLLIRNYDYWLVDDWAQVADPALAAILNQRTTQTRPLSIAQTPMLVTA
jgi:hypothetical protein